MEKLIQKVVVIGHGYTSRLAVIRSVAQIGCEITVIVMAGRGRFSKKLNTKKPIDCYSKYVSHVFYCYCQDELGLIQLLLDKCTDTQKKVIIIPDSDFSAAVIDKNQDILREYFLFPHIHHTPGAVELWMDKMKQKTLATTIGLSVASSTIIRVEKGHFEIPEIVNYPCFTKPLATIVGGKQNMKRCNNEEELRHDYDEVRHLAQANFNDSEVFLEKYVPKARHVEVQIFGNEEGEVAILGERDCSVQRRNQKVVEESPAPNLPEHVRKDMHAAAKRLAKAASYRNAGTVEFLYNEESEGFYFLEVNTRLQVEHGITEEVMGVDLVEWMVKEAAGELHGIEDLPLKAKGHAMEVRVYAEDCVNNFRPGGGKIDEVKFSDKARIETWIRDNIEVTALYDPMLAKLIVYGKDRNEALHKMWDVLDESVLYGVTNNMEYLQAFLHTEDYIQARLYTKMLDGFAPEEKALEVLDGGVQTTVQDYPGIIG